MKGADKELGPAIALDMSMKVEEAGIL